MCVNYKFLNSISLVDPQPLLSTDDILDRLEGEAKYYTKFDLCKGYYQLSLEEKSRDYSTFVCKRGLFRFKVMPMGLVSAGASFTRMMNKLLDKTEHLDSYLDDVLCHTNSWEDHISSLRQFFTRVKMANIRLKPSKCELGGNSVSFLGHRVTEDHRSLDNLNKIMEATRPQTKKQVMAFLGTTGFFSAYISFYSSLTAGLTDLLRKDMPNQVVWGTARKEFSNSTKLFTFRASVETSSTGQSFVPMHLIEPLQLAFCKNTIPYFFQLFFFKQNTL